MLQPYTEKSILLSCKLSSGSIGRKVKYKKWRELSKDIHASILNSTEELMEAASFVGKPY